MLEERLSKAYSQQTFGGYNPPPPRQPSGPYPSMATQAHNNASNTESFYTGQQPVGFQMSPNQAYQPTPQPQFTSYGPVPQHHPGQAPPPQQAQRSDGWQRLPASAPQDPYQQQQSPQQPNASPVADRRGSYYFGTPHPVQSPAPGPGPDVNDSPYPNLSQPMQLQSVPSPAQPQSTPMQAQGQPSQPSQPPQPVAQPASFQSAPAPPQTTHHSLQQQQPAHWQQQQVRKAMPQQVPQQPPVAPQTWAYTSYTQDSFPSVPQNDPIQTPAAEEALIEL